MTPPNAPERRSLSGISLARAFSVFLLLSALCSIPRFGQRENEYFPAVSDSDLYLEMARVFAGQAQGFTAEWVAWQPHHYNRPLLPFLAGLLGRYVLGGNLRAAFSIINILAAATISLLLWHRLQLCCPAWALTWVPSILFLVGFPQINWGYHILTDTLGLATAFATVVCAESLMKTVRQSQWTRRRGAQIILLLIVSSLAFLARETAWIAVVTCGWLAWIHCQDQRSDAPKLFLIVAVTLLGKVPHGIYAHYFHASGVPFRSSLHTLLDWRYVVDFLVKSGVCFNISWLLAGGTSFRRQQTRTPLPPIIVGWTIGGLLYIGAGYFANKISGIGYPLRMTYVLFPWVYFRAAEFMEGLFNKQRTAMAVTFCVAQTGISLLGALLDPGSVGITATGILDGILRRFSP